jgi:hypothetical protein
MDSQPVGPPQLSTVVPWSARQYSTWFVARLPVFLFKPDEQPVIPSNSLVAVIWVAPDADHLLI